MDTTWQYRLQDSAMGLFGIQFLEGSCQTHDPNEEDILASFPSACFLTSDGLALEHERNHSIPTLNVQPPTRNNTVYDQEQDSSQGIDDGILSEYAPWEPSGVGFDKNLRDAAQKQVVTNSLSTVPSDAGTSQVESFIDSGYFSSYKCETCDFVYRNASSRRKHIYTHIRPHTCPHETCKKHDEGFATLNDLERHEKSVHKNGLQTWWRCAYLGCQKSGKATHFFDRKDNFTAHIKRRHKDLTMQEEIDNLVIHSEEHPTLDEIQTALRDSQANKTRRPASTRSLSGGVRKRKPRSKSTASSVCSGRSPELSLKQSPQVKTVFPSSAPTGHQSMGFSYYGVANDLASVGGAFDALDPCLDMNSDNKTAIGLGLNLLSLSADQGAMAEMDTRLDAWQDQQYATTAQQSFPFDTLKPDQYIGQRDLGSNIPDQMNCQMNQEVVGGVIDPRLSFETASSFAIAPDVYSSMSTADSFQDNKAFSAGAQSNVSLNPGYDQVDSSCVSTFDGPDPYAQDFAQSGSTYDQVFEEVLQNMDYSSYYSFPLDTFVFEGT